MTLRSSSDPNEAEEVFNEFLKGSYDDLANSFDQLIARHPDLCDALKSLSLSDVSLTAELSSRSADSSEREPNLNLYSESSEGLLDDVVRELNAASASSRYELKGEIARGGMGAIIKVWDKSLRRTLAMKVALSGRGLKNSVGEAELDDRALSRFLDEAYITGQLDHPGIVPVYELGVGDDQNVYFTMRLVKGRTLGEIFNLAANGREGWTQSRAFGVLLKVCEAMAYAHSKNVIHRDLKPANIMVGRFGEVYVMDWGLARLLGKDDKRDLRVRVDQSGAIQSSRQELHDDSPDSPLLTMDGDVVGTPVYMSPEQANGIIGAMGPHSDVYAVGAMLYQLLAGERPYLANGETVNNFEVWKRVQNGPPTSLHTLAPKASAEISSICEKAMARDPKQRYPDMSALALDLSAYVEGRVVGAHEAGALAEAKKWIQRNKALASSVAIAIGLLVLGLAASIWLRGVAIENAKLAELNAEERTAQVRISNESRVEARRQADIAVAISEFFNTDLLGAVDPDRSRNSEVSLRAVVDQASQRIEGKFIDQPAVEGQLRQTLGVLYRKLGALDESIHHLDRALKLRESVYSGESAEVAETLFELASVWGNGKSDYAKGQEYARRSRDLRAKLLGADDPLTVLAGVELAMNQALGRGKISVPLESPVLDSLYLIQAEVRGLGETAAEIRKHWINDFARIAFAWEQGDREEAERILHETTDIYSNTPFVRDRISWAGVSLAISMHDEGELVLADALGTLADKFVVEQFGEDNSWTSRTVSLLGGLRVKQARYNEAEQLYLRALGISRRIGGDEHERSLVMVRVLNRFYADRDRFRSGENFLRAYLDDLSDPETDPLSLAYLYDELAENLNHSNSFSTEARDYTLRALTIVAGERRPPNGLKARLLLRLGRFQVQESSLDEAESSLLGALEIFEREKMQRRSYQRRCLEALVLLYEVLGHSDQEARYRNLLAESD
ncbi:MAG: tRNA A-37 threonylcarbamoyl transferase component Bud32/tetratricopeptide (TPR) repeat protein [Planctomycetota bacterium]|jgi:tRNA A-37 threonylcarbamoyl transferase component Bud32/tetratricopeptide (TPR) repeat protein